MKQDIDTKRLNEIRQDMHTVKLLQAKAKGKRGKGDYRLALKNLLEVLRAWEEASL